MKDEDARLTPDEQEEFIGAVLRRTSGGACARAEEMLAEHAGLPVPAKAVDGVADDLALLDAHLEHCSACAALARSLALAGQTLPSFASIDPGPAFTAAVLGATNRAKPGTIAEQLRAWGTAWVARPRFALEAAYVATLLILLVAGNPAATLQAASERTASVAAAGFERARDVLPGVVSSVPAAIELPATVRALGAATGSVIVGADGTGALSGAWNHVIARWSVTWNWMRGVAVDLAGRVSGALAAFRDGVAQILRRQDTEPRPQPAR